MELDWRRSSQFCLPGLRTSFRELFEKAVTLTYDYLVYLDYLFSSSISTLYRRLRFWHRYDISRPPQARLCGTCRRVDFGSLARLDKLHYFWRKSYRADLGLLSDVVKRETSCDLCRIIVESIRSQGLLRRPDEQRVKARSRPFYTTLIDTHTGKELAETKGTDHMAVVLEDRNGDQQLLRFQPCSFPIPKAQKDNEGTELRQGNLGTTFSGRILSNEESRLRLYQEWYRLCESQHGARCRFPKYPRLAAAFANPSHVIDVHTGCVTEATPNCRYVALSYVWGKTNNTQLTRKTSTDFMTKGVWNGLSETIKDAMHVADALGEQYLWVDSLCIYQDDAVHKQSQISQMAAIFSNAVFTIVAAAGENARVGLWPRTENAEHGQSPLHIGRHTLVMLLDQSFKSSEVQWDQSRKQPVSRYAWESRGWTFQEILCSRRVIVFTPVQVYWHCQEKDWLEETTLEYAPPCALRIDVLGAEEPIHFWSPNFNQFFRHVDAMLPHSFRSTEDALLCYVKLVNEYTKRYLTDPADGLNAFTGALSVLEDLASQKFIWGLPETEFGWALAWNAPYWVCYSRNPSRDIRLPHSVTFGTNDGECAPSWSWTAWYLNVLSEKYVWFNECEFNPPTFALPEINFYRKGRDGTLVLVRQRQVKDLGIPRPYRGDLMSTKGTEWYGPDDWKGEPRHIDGAVTTAAPKDFRDSGLLQFWTSTATLIVHRYMSEGKLQYVAMGAGYLQPSCRQWHEAGMPCHCRVDDVICVIHMGSTEHIPRWEHERRNFVSESYKRLPRPKASDEDEDGDLLALDFCVVSREAGRRDFLNVLVMERRGAGIWYRLGCTCVEEITWVHILNRRWSLVTLG